MATDFKKANFFTFGLEKAKPGNSDLSCNKSQCR